LAVGQDFQVHAVGFKRHLYRSQTAGCRIRQFPAGMKGGCAGILCDQFGIGQQVCRSVFKHGAQVGLKRFTRDASHLIHGRGDDFIQPQPFHPLHAQLAGFGFIHFHDFYRDLNHRWNGGF